MSSYRIAPVQQNLNSQYNLRPRENIRPRERFDPDRPIQNFDHNINNIQVAQVQAPAQQ